MQQLWQLRRGLMISSTLGAPRRRNRRGRPVRFGLLGIEVDGAAERRWRRWKELAVDRRRGARRTRHTGDLLRVRGHGQRKLRRLRIFGQQDKLKADRSKGA